FFDCLDCAANGRYQSCGIACGANQELDLPQRPRWRLIEGKIKEACPIRLPQVGSDIFRDTDNLDVSCLWPNVDASSKLEPEMLANRIFVGEEPARQTFADYRDFCRARYISSGKSSACHNPDPLRLEVTGANPNCAFVDGRQGQTGRLHARERVETFQQSPVEVNFPFLLVADNAWVSQDRQHLVALEAGINSVKSPQAADHQTSANQQGQRQRDLRNHQRLSQAEAQRAGWRAAFATFENWIQIDPLRNQGGRKSKQDARQQGDRDSERQRSPIKREANIGIAHFADQGGHQHARAPFCQEQPQRASEQGKQQAFCQQLTDQAPATCANSQTYGDLFSPGNCALQQQPRDIDCSDEQNN